MTNLTTSSSQPDLTAQADQNARPVFIASQQVMLSSAAAVGMPRPFAAAKIADAVARVGAWVHTTVTRVGRQRAGDPSYMEYARMAREMHRL
jgi:hypothetical protein